MPSLLHHTMSDYPNNSGIDGPALKRNERIRIGFLIHDVSRLRRTAFDARLKPMNITRSQWSVLAGVSRHHGGGITQTELAQVLDLGKVALGNLIDRLEDSGFVERRPDLKDRRVNVIHLTAKGQKILGKMVKVGIEMNAKIMKGVTTDDQHRLAQVLAKMKTNLVAMDTVPGAKYRAMAIKSNRAQMRAQTAVDGHRRTRATATA